MPIRPYLTAGVVLAGAGVMLANPPGPAEPAGPARRVARAPRPAPAVVRRS